MVTISGREFGPSGPSLDFAAYGNLLVQHRSYRESLCAVEPESPSCESLRQSYIHSTERLFNAQRCEVLSDSSISCMTVEGTGKNHFWLVSIGDQRSTDEFYEWDRSGSGFNLHNFSLCVRGLDENIGGEEEEMIGRSAREADAVAVCADRLDSMWDYRDWFCGDQQSLANGLPRDRRARQLGCPFNASSYYAAPVVTAFEIVGDDSAFATKRLATVGSQVRSFSNACGVPARCT